MRPAEYREQVSSVLSDSDVPVETRITDALRIGSRYLDLPIAFFTRIKSGTQKIVQSTGDHDLIQPGETCPLDAAYCKRTVETESSLAIQHTDGSSAVSEKAVKTFDLGAYIGARITVQDETYGTICFADNEPRPDPFSEAESYFVELTARLVGQALEQRSYEVKINERKREINRKEEVYRAVCEASFDLIVQVDRDGQFTFISSNCKALLGNPPEWYLGRSITAMLPDQETIEVAEEIYEAVLSGETIVREFFPFEHATGEQVLADIRVTPLYAEDVPPEDRTPDDIIGVQGMIRDARERRRNRRMIRVLNRVLRHNVRNDLNVIKGYTELLRKQLDETGARYADIVIQKSEQLTGLSKTARKLEEQIDTPPQITSIDIVPVAARLAAEVDDEYPDATVDVQTPESAVAESSPRLKTALRELLDNAANHAGDAPSITLTVQAKNRKVRVRVTDDGPGLPEQDRAVLLSGTETPLVHGNGLGLWLTHWIVESLNGTLRLNESDEGTCIEVELIRSETV